MFEDDNEIELENDEMVDLEDVDLEDVDLNDDDANIEEETAAAASIKMKPSRTAAMADLITHFASLPDADLNKFAESIKKPTVGIPDGAAAKNAATIAMKTVTKEELEGLFGDELSEDFRARTTTLFEAALNARVGSEVATISEELEAKYAATIEALEEAHVATLEEEVNTLSDTLYEQVDAYLNHVAESWLDDNQVAIERSLRAELAEDFMGKMKDLFVEHNLNIPDESEDVLGEMLTVNEELEDKVNALTEEVISLKAGRLSSDKDAALTEETQGLAATQIDRIRTLSEGIEFESIEDYTAKLKMIKESVTGKVKPSSGILVEEAPAITEDELNEQTAPNAKQLDPRMAAYMGAVSRTV